MLYTVNGPKIMTARGEGDSVYRDPGLSPATAGCGLSVCSSWGFAALHPRLYAVARYRGLAVLPRDDVLNTAIPQQLVESVQISVQYLVQAKAMRGKLFFKHRLHFAMLRCWWEVSTAKAVREIVDLAQQLRWIPDCILTLTG